MTKWQHRSVVYKLTLLFIYFIFLVYALAFSIPTWWGGKNVLGGDSFIGLWVGCDGENSADFDNCRKNAFGDDDIAWMDGVRGVWVGGMFFYVLALVYSLVENCCGGENSKDYGLTGVLALLAGFCGAAGVIVVAIEVEDLDGSYDYYWGYMLACITSGLTVILAIILLITRNIKSNEKPGDDSRTADYVFAHKQPNPYAPDYTNHGYSRDDIPLANGVSYQHTPMSHPYTMYQDGYNSNRNQGGVYGQQPVKSPYGYYSGRQNQLPEPSDASTVYTDLSNGYTTELINAEHTLSRTGVAQRGDFPRGGGDYMKQDFSGRNDYHLNGSRPY